MNKDNSSKDNLNKDLNNNECIELFNKLKESDDKGNIILTKECLKKFMKMNLLIIKEKQNIGKEEVFNYFNGKTFDIPSSWDILPEDRKKMFIESFEELLKILNI